MSTDSELQTVLQEKAGELFSICDVEAKGFISKRDMQRLCGHLPLDPDQIESVFDTLDDDGNGYLTLEEFTQGFGAFMGLETAPDNEAEDAQNDQHQVYEQDFNLDEDEHYTQTMGGLEAAGLFEESSIRGHFDTKTFGEDSVKELWGKLQGDHPELLPSLESLLNKMTDEIRKSQESYKNLETVLRTKSSTHDDEIRKLYDEMEVQIRTEREKVLAEERAKEKAMREELESEIREKERLYLEMLKNHEAIESKLTDLNMTHAETAQENERLAKERDELEEALSESQSALEESQSYVEDLQKKFKEDRRKRAKAAIELSEGIALERESLVRKLDTLRESNRKLKDESDMGTTGDMNQFSMGGEILHFHESGSPDQATGGKNQLMRGDSIQNLGSANVMVAEGETLADLMDMEDDDCEFDDGMDAYSPSNNGPVEYETIESISFGTSEAVRPDSLQLTNIVPPPDKEMSDFATSMTPPPSPPPIHRTEMEIQTEEDFPEIVPVPVVEDNNASTDAGEREAPEGTEDDRIAAYEAVFTGSKSPERVFKVVFVGDSGVGKSSIIHRFCHNSFKSTFSATIGIDFQIKTVIVEDRVIALQLWDTAGQERFRSITKQYFRKADGVVVVYDMTNSQTYLHLREWMESVEEGAEDTVTKMMIGNKLDLVEEEETRRAVPKKNGSDLADEYNSLFFEVSAKGGDSIQDAFQAFASVLTEREDRELRNAIRISANIEKKKGCCS